jgi:uncharacterized membrane protein|tara:strand:- start:1514 stop:2086 length:573 start_codon:yes stop_codon:yes gene_type:complete
MKITGKIRWLLVGVFCLIALAGPQTLLAQEEKRTDLFVRDRLSGPALPPVPFEPNFVLTLSLGNSYNELKAGKDNRLFLEIRNIGDTTITGIRLSSQGPEGWTIEFNPVEIDSLSGGNFQTVDLIVRPDSKVTKGGYNVTVIAEANEIRKTEAIWLNVVEPAFLWVWVGAIIVVAVIAAFITIFVRSSRR